MDADALLAFAHQRTPSGHLAVTFQIFRTARNAGLIPQFAEALGEMALVRIRVSRTHTVRKSTSCQVRTGRRKG